MGVPEDSKYSSKILWQKKIKKLSMALGGRHVSVILVFVCMFKIFPNENV